MELSIIIVTFNSEKDIRNCLYSIYDNTQDLTYEIVVVDNGSTDKTLKILNQFSEEQIIQSFKIIKAENKGFSYGNNIGIKNSIGKYICLLNPDTILVNNAFKIILNGMNKNKKIGMAGAKLFDKNMNENLTFGSFPGIYETIIRSLKIRKYNYYFAKQNKQYIYVDYPSGADFIFPRKLINETGYMDENYFLYYDETDFALKIKHNGYKAIIFTLAHIIHLQGQSTDKVSKFAEKNFLKSFIYYNVKNLSSFQTKCICYIKLLEFKLKKIINKKSLNFYNSQIIFYKKTLIETNMKRRIQ